MIGFNYRVVCFSMGLLCRVGGAESTSQGCALKEVAGCVVLTLFAEEARKWAGYERWRLPQEKKRTSVGHMRV